MNSSVKQAQKEGAAVGDISAGLSYSVVRNALYKVIKLKDAGQLGEQRRRPGRHLPQRRGAARLRAAHRGDAVTRPDIAGLMGAFGAALIAQRHRQPGAVSHRRWRSASSTPSPSTRRWRSAGCARTTASSPSPASATAPGTSPATAASGAPARNGRPRKSELPNLYDYKYRRIFGYRRLTEAATTRGDIGIPRVLNMYENYPFWFTVLSRLGFRVILSGRTSADTLAAGAESIPSENVCYPAKLAHGHLENLLDRGLRTIFYPCVPYEQQAYAEADNHFNCPIVAFYPQVLEKNVPRLREPGHPLPRPVPQPRRARPPRTAPRRGLRGLRRHHRRGGRRRHGGLRGGRTGEGRHPRPRDGRHWQWMAAHGTRGIVLAGRPYHVDPQINHGIPELITGLGLAVFTEDSIIDAPLVQRPLRVRDQWAYHTRLYEAAAASTRRAAPRGRPAELLRLRGGRDHHRPGAGDPRGRRQRVHRAEDRRGVEPRGCPDPAAVAPGRDGRAAAQRRDRRLRGAGPASVFTTAVRGARHTVYIPQMAPIHFRLASAVLNRLGYHVELLEHASAADVEVGLKYVNNDACYPAIMVIGQLVNKFLTGGADPANSSVAITQTGGMCRATNYAGMLRKGLADAGFSQVPVVAVSAQGLRGEPRLHAQPDARAPRHPGPRPRRPAADGAAAGASVRAGTRQRRGAVPTLGRHLPGVLLQRRPLPHPAAGGSATPG